MKINHITEGDSLTVQLPGRATLQGPVTFVNDKLEISGVAVGELAVPFRGDFATASWELGKNMPLSINRIKRPHIGDVAVNAVKCNGGTIGAIAYLNPSGGNAHWYYAYDVAAGRRGTTFTPYNSMAYYELLGEEVEELVEEDFDGGMPQEFGAVIRNVQITNDAGVKHTLLVAVRTATNNAVQGTRGHTWTGWLPADQGGAEYSFRDQNILSYEAEDE